MWGKLERGVLRAVADLLPEKLREVVDVLVAPVPPTPQHRIRAPTDEAAGRLAAVEHIVVVMRENRSFDHMLGYLSLPASLGGRGRGDVDGLRGPDKEVNQHDGRPYPIHHLQ